MREPTSKFENKDTASRHSYWVRLPAHIADFLEQMARSERKMVDEVLQELIIRTVEDEAEPLEDRMRRVKALITKIAAAIRKMPMQQQKDAETRLAREDRKKKRDHLVELGMEAYDELRRISSSEEAAKEAEFRLQAFLAMARIGAFNAALIRDQEAEDLEHLLAEIERYNNLLAAKLKKIEEERQEEPGRWRGTL